MEKAGDKSQDLSPALFIFPHHYTFGEFICFLFRILFPTLKMFSSIAPA